MNFREWFHRLREAIWRAEQEPSAPVVLPVVLPDVPAGLSRRAFLGLLTAATVGAATLDLDKLLWIPGTKTIFLPPTGEHGIVSVDWITRETLRLLKNNLQFAGNVNRLYDETPSARAGESVRLRIPRRFEVNKGVQLRPQYLCDDTKIATFQGLGIELDAEVVDATIPHTRNDVRRRVLEPAASLLTKEILDRDITLFAKPELPRCADEACVVTHKASGLALRGLRAFDLASDAMRFRLDLVGAKA
jgi:hypothetical protein